MAVACQPERFGPRKASQTGKNQSAVAITSERAIVAIMLQGFLGHHPHLVPSLVPLLRAHQPYSVPSSLNSRVLSRYALADISGACYYYASGYS